MCINSRKGSQNVDNQVGGIAALYKVIMLLNGRENDSLNFHGVDIFQVVGGNGEAVVGQPDFPHDHIVDDAPLLGLCSFYIDLILFPGKLKLVVRKQGVNFFEFLL